MTSVYLDDAKVQADRGNVRVAGSIVTIARDPIHPTRYNGHYVAQAEGVPGKGYPIDTRVLRSLSPCTNTSTGSPIVALMMLTGWLIDSAAYVQCV